MQISAIPINEVSAALFETWAQILESDASLDSAFFRPEFVQAVGQTRADVEVGVLKQGGEIVGFFPFQRMGKTAQAVVGRLSEFHGVIARPGTSWDPKQLMRDCNLSAWYFDHLPANQSSFLECCWDDGATSPYMDLSQGLEHYVQQRREAGSSVVSQIRRKARKLAREVGKLRFEFHTEEEVPWNSLVAWKTAQHERTGVLQVMKYPWVEALLQRLRRIQSPDFSGQFSALYAGDQLAAVHLGLMSQHALHIWFPAYNTDLHKYSPGLVLLLEMANAVGERGMKRIDFGKGKERYKAELKTGDTPLLVGGVDRRLLPSALKHFWGHAKKGIRQSPWRRQFEIPLEYTRLARQWIAFR